MIIVFDIGGTKIRVARLRDKDSFDEPSIIATPASFTEAVDLIASEVIGLTAGEKPAQLIGGIAGVLGEDSDLLVRAPHLSDWVGRKVASALREAVGCPVRLFNDADLATLGEAEFGAGKGFDRVVYLTVSTGVGGGVCDRGQLGRGVYTFEPGHQIIEGGKTLEELISGSALEARYGKRPYEIKEPEVWDEAARYLAVGLNNTILFWSPEVIVVGGSMMKSVGISIDKTVDHLRFIHKVYPKLPEVRHSALGDLGGLYGALMISGKV